mmetsp:Transcript_88096/g.247706  ORF Transcript_88096/g.247706 Transcript_88096/m.247706 type:complete len:140 (+) Transcript_88096:608-1027(+)
MASSRRLRRVGAAMSAPLAAANGRQICRAGPRGGTRLQCDRSGHRQPLERTPGSRSADAEARGRPTPEAEGGAAIATRLGLAEVDQTLRAITKNHGRKSLKASRREAETMDGGVPTKPPALALFWSIYTASAARDLIPI